MKRHANIPVFIPHYGCPNACVFCNQVRITGKPCYNEETVRKEIDSALSTIDPVSMEAEIAFFGGSFTAIPRKDMLALLNISDEYVKAGKVKAIRLSTRPDAINEEILSILAEHNVKTIELGIQSTAPHVLNTCKRGHTVESTVKACELIKRHNFELIGQMMVGLPSSSPGDETQTAKDICRLGADGARIYPTVVLPGTELARMEQCNEYTALTVEDATERCATVLDIFVRNSVMVIRIGLCANEILENEASHDSYHAAIGELVRSRVYRKRTEDALLSLVSTQGKKLVCSVPKGKISQVIGQKRANISYLKNKYGFESLRAVEDCSLDDYRIALTIE